MVKILQGSVVTQTMIGGLTIHPPVANFLVFMRQKLCKLAGRRQSYCKNYQATGNMAAECVDTVSHLKQKMVE